jgi:hypothetical protein
VKDRIEEWALNSLQIDGSAPYENVVKVITTAVNEALELAAKECETLEGVKWNMFLSDKPTSLKCSEAIRKLKEKNNG